MLADGLWGAMEPLVRQAKTHKGGQPPGLAGRLFFEALPYLGRTGIPLRDLPGEVGAWDAVYNRLRRWVLSGAMRRLFELLTAGPASPLTQTLIIHAIRTNRIPFLQSRASWPLVAATVTVMAVGALSPLGFTPLPLLYWALLASILFGYVVLTQAVKTWLLRKGRVSG